MNPSPLRRIAAVCVLWLAVGAGCHKENVTPKSCDDGTCCGSSKTYYKYLESFQNEPVKLSGPYGGWMLWFNNAIPTNTNQTWIKGAEVCSLTLSKVITLKQNMPQDSLLHCRVWGRLYISDDPTIIIGAARYFSIDKIEIDK